MNGLYSIEILRLAAASADYPRLADATDTAERRSPICGSRIVADVTLDPAGRVIAYGHEVRACALGQASSAILARDVIGRTRSDLVAAANALRKFLNDDGDAPDGWPELCVFQAARAFPARHAAILLPFEAAAEAAGAA